MAFLRSVIVLACVALLSGLASSAPVKLNYAELRTNVAHSLDERAHEMEATLAALLDVSRSTVALTEKVSAKCGA